MVDYNLLSSGSGESGDVSARYDRDEDMHDIECARKRISSWYGYYSDNIERGKADARFLYESQWTSNELAELRRLRKAIVQINKLKPIVAKVLNEFRESTPTVEVSPDNNLMNEDSVELAGNVLRTILYSSRSDIVFQTALEQSITRGYSAIRIYSRYRHKNSFHQELCVGSLLTPECAFFDPDASEIDKCDGDFAGYYDYISKESFQKEYPGIELPQQAYIPYDINMRWMDKACVVVAYYSYKKYFETTLYLIGNKDGTTTTLNKRELSKRTKDNEKILDEAQRYRQAYGGIPPELAQYLDDLPSTNILDSRKGQDFKVHQLKMIYNKVLERTEFPGDELPMVYIDGMSYHLDGRQKTQSLIFQARDAQRIHNFNAIEILTGLKNSRREQFIMHKEHLPLDESAADGWRRPELENMALFYQTPISPGVPPRPERLDPIPLNPDFFQMYQKSESDIKEIMGYNVDSERAMRGGLGVKSGQAVREHRAESNLSAHGFISNIERGMEKCASILMRAAPYIYDMRRAMTLQTPNNGYNSVILNEKQPDGSIKNDMSKLKDMKVKVTINAPYQLQQQDAWDQLISYVQVFPQSAPLVADIAASNLPIQQSAQLVKRIRKNITPPDITAEEEGKPAPPPEPDPQQVMMQKQMELAEKEVMLSEQELQLKKAELEFKEQQQQFEKQKMQMQQMLEGYKLQKDASQIVSQQRIAEIKANAEITNSENEAQMHALSTLTQLQNISSKLESGKQAPKKPGVSRRNARSKK